MTQGFRYSRIKEDQVRIAPFFQKHLGKRGRQHPGEQKAIIKQIIFIKYRFRHHRASSSPPLTISVPTITSATPMTFFIVTRSWNRTTAQSMDHRRAIARLV